MGTDENWAEAEFDTVDLGDKRRNKRLIELAKQRAGRPNGSISSSCGSAAAIKAAYRLLDNEAVGAEEILSAHYESSIQRAQSEKIVLAVQDTTELDYSHHPGTQGLGYLSTLKQQGMYVHSTFLVTPEQVPLGLIDQYLWMREAADFVTKKKQRRKLPIEEKESWKWIVSLEATARAQKQLPDTHIINVGDSEADVYDVFVRAQQLNLDIIVRAAQNRVVVGENRYLKSTLENQPSVGKKTICVSRRTGKPARKAKLIIHFVALTFLPPTQRQNEGLPKIMLYGVLAHEETPPEGEDPIQWLLLTTLKVTCLTEALMILEYYTCRWAVETYHKVLKSGCRVEERQFADADNLQRYLALDAIVAWRVLYLTMLSRAGPELPCTAFFASEEWQALACFSLKSQKAPAKTPSLQQAVLWLSSLGGFLGRKSDGHPGPKSLWIGLQRLTDITATWLLFHDT